MRTETAWGETRHLSPVPTGVMSSRPSIHRGGLRGCSHCVASGRRFRPAFAAVVVTVLLAGCSPSAGTGTAAPNDNTAGGFGNFSFDIGNQNASTNGAQEPRANAEAGAALYGAAEQECAVCHGANAEGTVALGGPLVGTSADQLRETLADGSNHRGESRPDWTDDDYQNLEAFLAAVGQDVGTNGTDTGTNG